MGSPNMTPYGQISHEAAQEFCNDRYKESNSGYLDDFDAAPFSPAGLGAATQFADLDANVYHTDDTSPYSSSNSSTQHHRHASSNSSRSVAIATGPVTPDAAQMHNLMIANSKLGENSSKRSLDAVTGGSEVDRQMNEMFDFDSAANSPGNVVTTDVCYERPTAGMGVPHNEPPPKPRQPQKRTMKPTKHERPQTSRSAVSSPSSFKPQSSWPYPGAQYPSFGLGGNAGPQSHHMQGPSYGTGTAPHLVANVGFVGPESFSHQRSAFTPPSLAFRAPGPTEQPMLPALIVHEIPSKTRVETQISLAMTITPIPQGITKLHLPVRTMAKPKLMAKSPPEKSPDILELDVMPVCASAMKQPHLKQRAFAFARGEGLSPQGNQKLDQPLSNGIQSMNDLAQAIPPLEGGPISICDGCMTREQKRADRRTVKQESDEDIIFKQGGKDRIVVFNEAEVVEWKPYNPSTVYISTGKRAKGYPRGKKKGDAGEGAATPTARSDVPVPSPERAKNVCLMMRITCYCRHQGESEGFQVILTMKDHEGKCVAQNISGPILITDDHKASGPQNEGKNLIPADELRLQCGNPFPPVPATVAPPPFHFPQSRSTNDFSTFHPHQNPHSLHRSATSLQLQRQAQHRASTATGLSTPSNNSSYRTSTTLTPRHLSRQVSPQAPTGPNPKRRKASGPAFVHRPLIDLSMTRMPTEDTTFHLGQPASESPGSSSEASEGLAMAPTTTQARPTTHERAVGGQNSNTVLESSPQPMFPLSDSNSMRDVTDSQPSGIESPQHIHQQSDNIMAAHASALHQSLLHVPGAIAPSAIVPRLTRIIPSEGPISGGVEVTVFGDGFYDGIDMLFGNATASRLQLHNSQVLICVIPPSVQAGLVNVSVKGFPQPLGLQVLFRYIDTNEQDLMRLALAVQYHRTTGKFANASDIARSIIHSQQSTDNSSQGQHQQLPGNNTMDLELSILGVLDVIDQADSTVTPRYNLRQPSNGQTMLHLSASLGYHRLTAGLLARGASPNLRDRNDMTAMHMACLHGHTKIVRKLLSAGGDPTVCSVLGLTAVDMGTSQEIQQVISTFQRHTRSRSVGATPTSYLSRASSFASLQSSHRALFTGDAGVIDSSLQDVIAGAYRSQPLTPAQAWARSRRNSASDRQPYYPTQIPSDPITNTHLVGAAAAMAVWRDNLAGQIQQFQQSLQRTLPNLQMPNLSPMNLPPLPNFEAYQEHPMVRRISSLVPRMNNPPAPPAYDEIYPDATPMDLSVKKASAARAMGDAIIDQKCAVNFDQPEASGNIVQQQHNELRLVHARQEKKLRNDRKLFFVWVSHLYAREL
ncbi:MAG: hypothetical protein Q9218_003493 [Villophora microphyllina]